jgi:hypothetical protein
VLVRQWHIIVAKGMGLPSSQNCSIILFIIIDIIILGIIHRPVFGDRDWLCRLGLGGLVPPEDGDRFQDNVQNYNSYTFSYLLQINIASLEMKGFY